MKKMLTLFLALALALVLVVGLVGCGSAKSADSAAYEASAKALAKKFRENFAKKYPDMPAHIVSAGPKG